MILCISPVVGVAGILAGTGIGIGGAVADSHFWRSDVPHCAPVVADVALYHHRYVACDVGWRNVENMEAVKSEA